MRQDIGPGGGAIQPDGEPGEGANPPGSYGSIRPMLRSGPSRPRQGASSDHELVARCRAADQDAAAQLYLRYARRLKSLVRRQCSAELARCAGVEDIVQSVFASFFRRVGEGFYAVADGDTAWRLLFVIAINRVRAQATYYYAAKRNLRKTIGGAEGRKCLRRTASLGASLRAEREMILQNLFERLPPRNQILMRLVLDGLTLSEAARTTGRSISNGRAGSPRHPATTECNAPNDRVRLGLKAGHSRPTGIHKKKRITVGGPDSRICLLPVGRFELNRDGRQGIRCYCGDNPWFVTEPL